MRTTSLALTLVGALALAGGCSSQAPTRAVSGQLRVDTSAMHQPVVIAQSSDHRVFVANVTASGRFTLQLPAGAGYRMTLASSASANGVYSAAARINWPLASGPARWAVVGDGAAIDLGAVYKRGTRPTGLGTSCDSCGGSGGDDHGDDDHGGCHEDEHACNGEQTDVDDDCDHKVGTADHCDQDDQADEHDQDADDDDHARCAPDMSGGGGAGGGGGGAGTGGVN
ncbi:MAG: hypothetical protein ACXVAN_08725 [Polyangia bacterium]